jgi:hypothetical protein
VCAKVRHLQYKVRRLQYKISEITGICRGCTLPANACKYPANACNFLPNYCFFVSSVHLPVEAGYGGSFSVASNVFVRTNLTFTPRNKNNAPLWMGNPRCQVAWFLPALRLCRLLTLLLLLWQLRSNTGINSSRHIWVAIGLSDSSIAHDGAHRIKQTSDYQSGVVSSAIEEDFVAAIDADLSCIGRYCGDRRQDAIWRV